MFETFTNRQYTPNQADRRDPQDANSDDGVEHLINRVQDKLRQNGKDSVQGAYDLLVDWSREHSQLSSGAAVLASQEIMKKLEARGILPMVAVGWMEKDYDKIDQWGEGLSKEEVARMARRERDEVDSVEETLDNALALAIVSDRKGGSIFAQIAKSSSHGSDSSVERADLAQMIAESQAKIAMENQLREYRYPNYDQYTNYGQRSNRHADHPGSAPEGIVSQPKNVQGDTSHPKFKPEVIKWQLETLEELKLSWVERAMVNQMIELLCKRDTDALKMIANHLVANPETFKRVCQGVTATSIIRQFGDEVGCVVPSKYEGGQFNIYYSNGNCVFTQFPKLTK